MERPTPRVNSSNIGDFHGKIVRVIGKVIRLDGNSAMIQASDNGNVPVRLTRDSNFVASTYVEVLGRVNAEDNSISEYTSVNMGDNIDMNLVEQVVQLTHRYPDIFPLD